MLRVMQITERLVDCIIKTEKVSDSGRSPMYIVFEN